MKPRVNNHLGGDKSPDKDSHTFLLRVYFSVIHNCLTYVLIVDI